MGGRVFCRLSKRGMRHRSLLFWRERLVRLLLDLPLVSEGETNRNVTKAN